MKALITLMICSALSLAKADEIKLPDTLKVGNVSYTGVVYSRHDAAYVTFQHESGIGRVRIADLPVTLQKLLGYDATIAGREPEVENKAASIPQVEPQTAAIAIHGRLVVNTEKGLLIAVTRESVKTRHVQTWKTSTTSDGTATEDSSSDATRESGHSEETDEPIYETILYLVRGNSNAEYLKPGITVNYMIIPAGADSYKGEEAVDATLVRNLE